MTLDELLLNIKSIGMNTLVCQTEIQTESDKQRLGQQGYFISLTEEEFKSQFDLDPSCVWYTPSVSCDSLYFNKQTMAASPFQICLFTSGMYTNKDALYRAIESREREAAEGDFSGAIASFPDAMCMEYFNLLLEKKGATIPDLYNLFFSTYLNSDYGFGNIEPSTLKAILASKPASAREATAEKLKQLPDPIKIYRGGNSASTPLDKAYSWTLDINVANFFASRRGKAEGYIVEAEVAKKDVIDFFPDDRNELEIIADPDSIHILDSSPIHGLDFAAPIFPVVAPTYHAFLDKLDELDFAQDSMDHGPAHEARVLMHCLTISEHLGLSMKDRKALATAAIYHDTQRTNDDTDPTHGKASKEYYLSNVASPDPLVAFLCEYHCLPDELAHKEIQNNRQLSKNRNRARLLYDIFKDADALDRVRFGIKDLDLNQLRVPISKELTLVARLYLEQLKPPEKRRPSLAHQIKAAQPGKKPHNPSTPAKRREYEPSL